MNAFVTSHFSNYPLTWTFHSRNVEHHVNKIHKWALNLVCNDELP